LYQDRPSPIRWGPPPSPTLTMLDRLFATMRELGRIVHALEKTALAELDDIEVQAARNHGRKGP